MKHQQQPGQRSRRIIQERPIRQGARQRQWPTTGANSEPVQPIDMIEDEKEGI